MITRSAAAKTSKPFVDNLNLSIDEMVVLCAVNVKNNPASLKHQKNIAAFLAKAFNEGAECPVTKKKTAIDKYKAANYSKYPFGNSRPITHDIYEVLSTWTLIRLCIMRMNYFANAMGHAFLNRFYSIGGLTYAVELIIDTTMMLKSSIRYKGNDKNPDGTTPYFWTLPFKQRLKALWQKDNRRARMLTALTWLTINIIILSLTGGASGLAAVGGFFFDLGLEIYKFFSVNSQKNLIKKLTNRVQKIDLDLIVVEEKLTAAKTERLNTKPSLALEIKINNLKKDKDLLLQEKNAISIYSHKIAHKMKNERWVNGITAGMAVLCGIATAVVFLGLLFPPTIIPSALVIAAAATTVLAGSVFGGLGPRIIQIWNRTKLRLSQRRNPELYPRHTISNHIYEFGSVSELSTPSSSSRSSTSRLSELKDDNIVSEKEPLLNNAVPVKSFALTHSLHVRKKPTNTEYNTPQISPTEIVERQRAKSI